MCTARRLFALALFLGLIGGGLIALGYFVPSLIHSVLIDGLKQQRIVTGPNSTGWDQWYSTDYDGAPPQYFNAYLWNVTNPEEVKAGAKPKLNQTGPWVYQYHSHNFDVKFSEDLNLVQTKKFESYVLVRDKSVSDPTTTSVTVINIPFAGIRAGLPNPDQWWSALILDLVTSIADADIFVTQTAHETIWGGNSPILEWLKKNVDNTTNPVFGLQFNDTTEDEARIRLNYTHDVYRTGNDNFSAIGQYVKWHNLTDLAIWNGTEANTLYGVDGSAFETEMDNENYTVFVDTLYRHVNFWYNSTLNIQGVPTRRYWLDPQNFWNHTMGNDKYSLYGPQGLTNMTGAEAVQQGQAVPIFICLPLFFQSDPVYRENLHFLPPNDTPDQDKHNTELNVEPISGITVAAHKRIQVNIQFSKTMILYPQFQDVLFPIAWFELTSTLTPDQANQWLTTVGTALWIESYGGYIVYGVGGLFGLFCLMAGYGAYSRNKEGRKTGYDFIEDGGSIN